MASMLAEKPGVYGLGFELGSNEKKIIYLSVQIGYQETDKRKVKVADVILTRLPTECRQLDKSVGAKIIS